jgi:hypothetical protein
MLALPCLLSAAVLALWLVTTHATRLDRLGRVAVLAIVLVNPITLKMLEIGHPEEMLAGVLCVAALVAAGHERPTLAGILLGIAVGAKAWAIIAVGPVVLAAPWGRMRILAAAAAAAGCIAVPVLLAKLTAATGGDPLAAAATGSGFQPWQMWWFLGEHDGVVRSLYGIKPGYRTAPEWLSPVAHPALVLVALGLSAHFAARRPRASWHDALLLLAFVFLVRCVLDPWNTMYYAVPFLLALTTWEVVTGARLPVLSLAVAVACWLTFQTAPTVLPADAQSVLYLAWSLPLLLTLGTRTRSISWPFDRRRRHATPLVPSV